MKVTFGGFMGALKRYIEGDCIGHYTIAEMLEDGGLIVPFFNRYTNRVEFVIEYY